MINYNSFHLKNVVIQNRVITSKNYTYQTLVRLMSVFFIKRGKVLDFGCGVGTIDFYLGKLGYKVTGVDVSDRAIGLANESKRELGQAKIEFICSSLEQYNSKQKYDYVICSEVLEHIESPKLVINKMFTALKKGGIGIISTPSSNAPLYRWGLLTDFDRKVGHLRRYDISSLCEIFKNSGFKVVDTYRVEGLLRNLMYSSDKFGKLLRFVKYPISIFINLLDNLLITIFGESNIYIVVKKI